jgi:hypothetical protein
MDIGAVLGEWSLWPPPWYAVSGIVAFIIASYAVHNWRELGILVLLVAALVFPIKWLGPMLGLPVFAEDAITFSRDRPEGGWGIHVGFSAASVAAIILAAALMVAWKEIAARRAEKAADANSTDDRDAR